MVVAVAVVGNRWGVSRETRPKLIVTTFKVFSFFPLFLKITRKKTTRGEEGVGGPARSVWAAVCFTVRKGSVCIAQYYASLLFHPRCRERSPVAMQFDFAAGPDPLVIRRRRRYLSDRRPIVLPHPPLRTRSLSSSSSSLLSWPSSPSSTTSHHKHIPLCLGDRFHSNRV